MNHPLMLIGIPFVLLFIGWTIKKQKGLTIKKQFIFGRILICVLLILSACGIRLKVVGKNAATIFLLDVSDSMRASRMESKRFIDEALLKLPKNHEAGVIIFGQTPQMDKFLNSIKQYDHIGNNLLTSATNIEQALQLAVTYLPEEANKEIILISDGAENEGDMQRAAELLRSNQIDFKVYQLGGLQEGEVYVDKLSVPERTYKNESFKVTATIMSNVKTKAQLSLFSGGIKKVEQEVELEVGENNFVFQDVEEIGGFKNYRISINPVEDHELGNNEYCCYTTVEDAPKLLVIEGKEGEALGLKKLLEELRQDKNIILPADAPTTSEEMMIYQTILLCNVYSETLPKGFLDQLEGFVKNGGGLIVSGGDDSYALGCYQNTVLEKLLPVDLHKKGKMAHPSVSLCLVIDHSGSMSDMQQGVSKLGMSIEAAARVVDYLTEEDEISVLSFDDSYTKVVERQKVTDKEKIKGLIYGIQEGGGTSIYPALEAAYQEQINSKADVKHIILLTDGEDNFAFNQYKELLGKNNEAQISLSTVAVGNGANFGLLKALAENGNGSYYQAQKNDELPKIFAKEYFLSTGEYLINEHFMANVASDHEILTGIKEGIPLEGYIGSSIKPLALQVLTSHYDEPVLALWHYGLGKVVAWTSDMSGQWTKPFFETADGYQLLSNMLTWSMTTYEGEGKVSITEEDQDVKVTFAAADIETTKSVSVSYENEDKEQQQIQLVENAPGIYEGKLSIGENGFYRIHTIETLKDGQTAHYLSAFAKQYSKEYKFNDDNEKLQQFIQSVNGSLIHYPNEAFKLESQLSYHTMSLDLLLLLSACLLFLVDIIARRFQWHLSELWISRKAKKSKHLLWNSVKKVTFKILSVLKRKEDKWKNEPALVQSQKEKDEEPKSSNTYVVSKTEQAKVEKRNHKKAKERTPTLDTASLLQHKKERQN